MSSPYKIAIEKAERWVIKEAYKAVHFKDGKPNVSGMARWLGISQESMYTKLRKYDIRFCDLRDE